MLTILHNWKAQNTAQNSSIIIALILHTITAQVLLSEKTQNQQYCSFTIGSFLETKFRFSFSPSLKITFSFSSSWILMLIML